MQRISQLSNYLSPSVDIYMKIHSDSLDSRRVQRSSCTPIVLGLDLVNAVKIAIIATTICQASREAGKGLAAIF